MGALEEPSEHGSDRPGFRYRAEHLRPLFWRLLPWGLFAIVLAGHLPALFGWRFREIGSVTSMTALRRLAAGTAFYAEDWDSRLMPFAEQLPNGNWLTWPERLRPYVKSNYLNSPRNPVVMGQTRDPKQGYPVLSAYAVNRRFWDTFGKGPYPLDNLDVPERTVLFVEAGPMWRDPLTPPKSSREMSPFALLTYGDVTDRVDGFCPYPSAHGGKMALVAVDGHAETVTVENYTPSKQGHDTLYGRIGGQMYNWNGGYPHEETDKPPRE